jgi:4-hydroxythreonine-4-phosphate dehydrogenase
VLFGDQELLHQTASRLGLGEWLHSANARIEARPVSHQPLPLNPAPGNPGAAHLAVACLRTAALACLAGELDALVTAPVSKAAILRAGIPFVGQTEFLAELAQCPDTSMMLLGRDATGKWLRVVVATTHVSLRRVPDLITVPTVRRAIQAAALAGRMLHLPRCRIGVCGLNPHAGEGGLVGDEEQNVICPAIRSAAEQGMDIHGPLAADTAFHAALGGDYDVIVAMYHDQGLAPLKTVAFESGVNWSVGLPFIRTSPDHGTAYDIAGKGSADAGSMIAAVNLAEQLVRARGTRR